MFLLWVSPKGNNIDFWWGMVCFGYPGGDNVESNKLRYKLWAYYVTFESCVSFVSCVQVVNEWGLKVQGLKV